MIYMAENKINGKRYIGYTSKNTIKDRKRTHIKRAKCGSTHFYNAIRKYGEDNFDWKILDKTLDISMESVYIKRYDTYRNGYNMTKGGEGGDTISMKSAEEKKRQGAKIGNVPWNKGVSMKELGYEFYDNRNPRTFTEEQKKSHGDLVKTKKYYEGLTNRKHGKSRKVFRESDGKTWETIKSCAEEIGVNPHKVRRCIMSNKLINNESFKWGK